MRRLAALAAAAALAGAGAARAAEHRVDCGAGAGLAQLQAAADRARCGDRVRVRGVCEAFGGRLVISRRCTAERPLRFVGDGPVAELNGTHPGFRSAPNAAWRPVDAARGEYRSVERFPRWRGRARGHFRDPRSDWNALVAYRDRDRLRAAEYGAAGERYAGPGVTHHPGDSRLYLRLGGLPGIAADCGSYDPGDLDPNHTPLEISQGVDGTLRFTDGAAHVVWDGIDVVGGRIGVRIDSGAHDLVVSNARIRAHHVALRARAGVRNLRASGNRLETLAPPWLSWDEQKGADLGWGGTGMIGFDTGDHVEGITITRSHFSRPFDVLSPGGPGTRDVEFSHNVVDWNGDDAWQLGTDGASDFRAFGNHFLRAAFTWSRSLKGGSTARKGSLLFYRNVVDSYHEGLKLHSKPASPGAVPTRAPRFPENFRSNGAFHAGRDDPGVERSERGCFHVKAPHGKHGSSGGQQSVKYYNNTYVLGGSQSSRRGGWQIGPDPEDVQHLKRNIIVWIADLPVLRDWEDDARFEADGNVWHLPRLSPGTPMFESMPDDYPDLATYQAATGRALRSVQADPGLRDAVPGGAYCPDPSGPAGRAAIALDPLAFPGVEGIDYVGAVDPRSCRAEAADPDPPDGADGRSRAPPHAMPAATSSPHSAAPPATPSAGTVASAMKQLQGLTAPVYSTPAPGYHAGCSQTRATPAGPWTVGQKSAPSCGSACTEWVSQPGGYTARESSHTSEPTSSASEAKSIASPESRS